MPISRLVYECAQLVLSAPANAHEWHKHQLLKSSIADQSKANRTLNLAAFTGPPGGAAAGTIVAGALTTSLVQAGVCVTQQLQAFSIAAWLIYASKWMVCTKHWVYLHNRTTYGREGLQI
jgi:hypothetical protein